MSSPVPRPGDRLLVVIALLVAFLLHLPAHLGWSGGLAGREALYEDGPAVVSNAGLEPQGREGLGPVLARAATHPSAAWGVGDGSVGRSSWRPVSTCAFAIQRWCFGSGTAQGVAAVSLLLHLTVVLLTLRLLASMDAPRAARWGAGLVVAACPAALSVAAWPAHQPILLATALGMAGVVVFRREGVLSATVGIVLIALAALAHEAAFGFFLALLALRWTSPSKGRRWSPRVLCAAAILLLVVVAWMVHSAVPTGMGSAGGRAGVAWLHAAVSLVLPARLHFADGPWTVPSPIAWTLRAGFVAAIVLLAIRASGRWRSASAWLAYTAMLTLVPAIFILQSPRPGFAPYHDGLLYLVLPLLAGSLAWAIASVAGRGGSLRVAAAVAGALWVGANVNATATRAASFRTRAAHVELAAVEMPHSPVVEAWRLDLATTAAVGAGPAASERLQGLAPRAAELAARTGGAAADALRADPVAATTIASALARFAQELIAGGVPPVHASLESAELAAQSAADLVPGWSRPWIVLATTRERAGSLRDAMAAAQRAGEIDPTDVDVRVVGVSVAYSLGDLNAVTTGAEQMLSIERAQAKAAGRRPRSDVMLLYARAVAADGTNKAPDQWRLTGLRYRFETAWAVLKDLIERGERVEEARRELYSVCLRYGDFLVSKDRVSLALVAYRDAVETGVRDTEAAEHQQWLLERLKEEERLALAALARAERGDGNVVDALVAVAIALARQAKGEEAAEVFAKIEESLGMSPVLRYHRAMQLWRELDPRRAIAELRQAVADDRSLARAHYDLALLLEETGELDAALASCERARSLADERATTEGAEEWLLDADLRIEELRQVLRDLGGAR